MVDVSIIIVNWNTKDLLRDCLRSVYGQTKNIAFEVIVIDNASSDRSISMVRQEFPRVILIENLGNRGFASANNQGMEIAMGRYILLLNSDTIVLDGAIQKSTLFADQNPSAAIVGVRIENPDGTLSRDCFRYASLLNLTISTFGMHRLFPRSRLWGRESYSWWDYGSVREVEAVTGCYMLTRRQAIEIIGKMDESYFMYGEEMDWCWRFHKAGWKILYYPEAHIIHYGGKSSAQNPVGMSVELQKSFLRFIDKRQGRAARLAASGLLFLNRINRLLYWSLRWIIGPNHIRSLSIEKLRQIVYISFRL